jgi:hypothetical protein
MINDIAKSQIPEPWLCRHLRSQQRFADDLGNGQVMLMT